MPLFSHRLDELEQIADRVVVTRDTRVVPRLTPLKAIITRLSVR